MTRKCHMLLVVKYAISCGKRVLQSKHIFGCTKISLVFDSSVRTFCTEIKLAFKVLETREARQTFFSRGVYVAGGLRWDRQMPMKTLPMKTCQ